MSLVKGYMALGDEDKKKPCALDAVAKASFALIQAEYDDYEKISLNVSSDKVLAANLTKKLAMIEALTNKYTQVLSIGQGDFGIASLYRIGKMYQHLAQALFNSPCPKKLDEDQCFFYQGALQEKAFPLEEKAVEAFDKALAKAYELGLYNEWLTKTQDAMISYEPDRFPEIHTYDLIASETVSAVPQLMEAN